MPALLTSTSIDLKRDRAVSTILAAVAGSPMWPSTRATWLEAATSVDWVTFQGIGNDVEPPFDKPLHDSRADPLRSPSHDGCLPLATHGLFTSKTSTVIWLLRKRFERKLIAPWLVKRQGRFSG